MPRTARPRTADYRLTVTPHVNERTLQPTTLLVLETAQSFASFRYELSVEERRAGAELTLRVLGLNAPQLTLPAAGPARFAREYADLAGTCTITVEGLDGAATSFTLHVGPGSVEPLEVPRGGSVTLVTGPAAGPPNSQTR